MRSATLLVALHATQALLAPSTVTKTPARAAPTATEPEMCRALPWLERPAGLDSLKDADYAMYLQAGDFGFDPLGWAEVGWGLNEGESVEERDDRLYAYREAELKHGRLAMLAAVGWPLSELYDGRLSMRLGMRPELVNVDDSGVGLAPSLLNGGLGQVATGYWGVALFLGAYWEGIGVRRLKGRAREGQKRAPGDLGFDPLGLLPDKSAPERRKRMLEQELTHGRTAMLAIVGFAIQEFLQFFVPPEGVEQAFFPHVGENFFLRKDVEAEFYLFELVGEILKGFLPTVPH